MDLAASPHRIRRRWLNALKTVIGLSLLAALLLQKDRIRQLQELLSRVDLAHVLALIGLSIALNVVASIKWGFFIQRRAAGISLPRLLALYLIGKFFGNVLPSMMGGDLARAFLLGRSLRSQSDSAASVIMERATGLMGLVVVALTAIAMSPGLLRQPVIAVSVAGISLACLAGLALFFRPSPWLAHARRWQDRRWVGRPIAFVNSVLERVVGFRHSGALLRRSLAMAVLFHLLACLNVYIAALSIGFHPAFVHVMAITPIILMLTMIPVSPNNLGWWEWCFSVLFEDVGGTAAQGLVVALILRAVALLVSLAGGVLFLVEGRGDARAAASGGTERTA
jgi:glycosyltransferase 2 family protein